MRKEVVNYFAALGLGIIPLVVCAMTGVRELYTGMIFMFTFLKLEKWFNENDK